MNPGTSLHFDGKALEEQEEAELKQDDLKREQELRELLSTALPDDLLDDDTASFSSHESSGSLSQHDNSQTTTSPDPWNHLRQKLPAHHRLIQLQTQHTSTPNGYSNPPPLKTPGPSHQHQVNQQHYIPSKTNGASHVQNGPTCTLVESSDNEWIEDHTIGQQYERGEVEGAARDEVPETGRSFPGHEAQQRFKNCKYEQSYDVQGMTNGINEYQDYGNHDDYQATNGMNGYHNEYADEDQMQNGGDEEPSLIENVESNHPEQRYNKNIQQYSPSDNHKHTQQYSPNHQQHHQERNVNQQGKHLNHGLEPSSIRVQYRGGISQQQAIQPNGFPAVTNQATVGFAQDAGDQLQEQFLGVGGDEESRQMAQLQILYKARGRELDHLSSQLQVLKEESGREKRILNHQLALAQGEKAGVNASYEQCQELLIASQQETSKLTGQLQAAHVQIQALNAAKHQVEEKLQSTEAAIESLSSQLTELQRSQPLAKAREQQDGFLKNLQQRYEQELMRLKEKVDSSQGALEDKCNEVASLHHQLSSVTKSAEQQRLEQGNTINTLTKQLQQSQKQCRDLLETGSLQEINLLRVQLQQVQAARNFSEDMTAALQEELSEMKEQLQMYESAVELGVTSAKSPESTQNTKSFAVRNLAKLDWKTPQIEWSSTDPSSNMTPDDLIRGLRKELERSLQSNRTKRGQVAKLQSDLKASKTEIETMKNKVLESETTGKDTEVRLKVLEAQLQTSKSISSTDNPPSSMSAESSKDLLEQIDQLQSEKKSNVVMMEELRSKVSHLKELNTDLKKQMAEMVADWDKDKKIDLDRVQRTCLQLHEDSSRNLREQMVSEFQSERDMLKEAHQHQLQELRTDLEQAQKELDEVKGLYIDVCEEKNSIQDTVTETLKAEATKQLDEAKLEWQTQHDTALKELHESLKSSHRAAIVTTKNTWRKEMEEENKLLVEEKVALAKVEWSEMVRKEAMKSALTAADAEWQLKIEAELEQRNTKVKEELEKKHQDYLKKRIKELQRDHEVDKAKAIKTSLSNAKTEWMIEAEANTKEKVKKAIEMAREPWTNEDADQRVEDAVSSARRRWSNERVNMEKVKHEWMQEHGEKEISRRVAEITETLEAKHLSHITSLQELMDKGKQRLKQEMKDEKLCALQEAKNRLEREHHEALKEALKVSRSEAENAKMKSLAQKSSEWQAKLDEMLKAQQEVVNKAVQEAREQWNKRKHKMEETHKKALESLQAEAEADQEELRTKYERELERGIEEAVTAAREQWSQNCDAELRKTCDEILDRKGKIWHQEREDLLEQLKDANSQLQSSLKQGDRHRKKQALSKQKMEKEIESLKEQLQDADREMKQTEYNLRRDLEKLQSRLKGANVAVVEELEAKMEKMRRKHEEELIAMRQRRCDQKQLTDSTSQTNNNDCVSVEAMQELKAHYITTVKKIKVDVIKRMEDMRENFRCAVHTEVMKERHSTTKKLRRYYLQCLQEFLEEDSQNPRNRTKAQSTASKLAAMAKALDLQSDELTMINPRPVTSGPLITSLSTRPTEVKRSHDSSSADGHGNIDPMSSRKGPDIEGRPLHFVPSGTSTVFRGAHDKSSTSQSSSNQDGSGIRQTTPPDNSATSSRKSSVDLGASSKGISWEDMETGISLGKLPIQPREFNPRPERLPSQLYEKSCDSSMSTTSSSYDSITARSRESSPSHSVSRYKAQLESRSRSGGQSYTNNPLHRANLKSQESSPETSTSDTNRGQLKILGGPSRMTERNTSSHSLKHKLGTKSQESSPETSATPSPRLRKHNYTSTSTVSSNITTRTRQNKKQCILSEDIISSEQSPFMKPITTVRRNTDSMKGPLKVPPPSERTAAMLASIPMSILKPVPQSTWHTQIPSLGPNKPTDTSTASLDTIYNDLPACLNIQDIPHDDITLDKVVRFDCVSQEKMYTSNYKSHTDEATRRPSSTSKVENTSTLPSKMNLRTNIFLTRSGEKLTHMLQQDSGFVSPQVEEQI